MDYERNPNDKIKLVSEITKEFNKYSSATHTKCIEKLSRLRRPIMCLNIF